MDPVTAIFILILFFGLLRRYKSKNDTIEQALTPTGVYPYVKKDSLLVDSEKTLLSKLLSIVGRKYTIYTKVNMTDILDVKEIISASAKPGYRNKINTRCADFVLCEPTSLRIIAVVILESTKNQSDGAVRDNYLDKACKAASLPLIRFKASYDYSEKEIVATLRHQLRPKAEETPSGEPMPTGSNPIQV